MIYVTQGHEKGIGLEVFLKSALLLAPAQLKQIILIVDNHTLLDTLDSLKFDFELSHDQLIYGGITIKLQELPEKDGPQSKLALDLGMELCEKNKNSILFTLPTSKDQLDGHAGHTEYFRHHYNNKHLPMYFYGPDFQVMLLSDHDPVNKLSALLKSDYINKKIQTTLDSMTKWNIPFKRVYISGLNPHAGEGGILGNEENELTKLIPSLSSKYKDVKFIAPVPADTMIFNRKNHDDLFIYCFHDQGLGVFKGHHGLIGANITLGLPFLRMSVDHGTAFNLYGKNSADDRGCYYVLKLAFEFMKRMK